MAEGLLHVLWLEGDHANEAVDGNQVREDHHREDAVLEEPPQGRHKIWWGTKRNGWNKTKVVSLRNTMASLLLPE